MADGMDYGKKIGSAQTMQLIGGILGGVGNLANSLNEVYQLSKGRQAAPIGNLGIALGNSLGGFGEMKQDKWQREYAANTVSNMPGLDETSKNLALAGIRGGDVKSGMRAATDAIKAQKTGAIKEYEYGKTDPAFNAFMMARRKAGSGGGGGSVSAMDKVAFYTMQKEYSDLNRLLNDPIKAAMLQSTDPLKFQDAIDRRNAIGEGLGVNVKINNSTNAPAVPKNALVQQPTPQATNVKKVYTMDEIE